MSESQSHRRGRVVNNRQLDRAVGHGETRACLGSLKKHSSPSKHGEKFAGLCSRGDRNVPLTAVRSRIIHFSSSMCMEGEANLQTQCIRRNLPLPKSSYGLIDAKLKSACRKSPASLNLLRLNATNAIILWLILINSLILNKHGHAFTAHAQSIDSATGPLTSGETGPSLSESSPQATTSSSCFGGLQTFEKISMSSFESPSSPGSSSSFGNGILVQQDDQALTSECVNLCRSQSNCLSFVIDYNKYECKSYATTQQELQQEFEARFQTARSVNNSTQNATDSNGYQATAASNIHLYQLLPSASSNYFEKICLDGVANRNQFNDVCGHGRLWAIERVFDSILDGFVEKEVTNVNNKDECSKLCIFETQFVCRSADYDQHSRLCRLSKEDRRTQPQAMRHVPGSSRQYLENQCATPGPSSCVYETKKNAGIISMDALKFAQTVQDCQMKCNSESTFNCRSYSFNQQRCFLSGDDSVSLNSNLIKLPVKQGWLFGEKRCSVELCTKGMFSYEKITGYTLRSALSATIDLMAPSGSTLSMAVLGNDLDNLERLQHEASQKKLQQLLPVYYQGTRLNSTSNIVSTMMMMAANSEYGNMDPMYQSASTSRQARSANNLAITEHCRHSCDLGYLNCPAFTIDYKNNRCQRLDRNSQGRHHELVARDGHAYYEKICLRVPEIMSMCQDKLWIFERVVGYELAPRLYDKTLKFVQSRRDCEEYCLEEKQFQCRSALYNDETSDCKLSRFDRRIALQDGSYYRNFNVRVSYLENQCIRDRNVESLQCYYEQTKEQPAYPTFTERIEIAQLQPTSVESEGVSRRNSTIAPRYGSSYCEQLCNDNVKFECHSFGYYASTAQCFISGDDSVSAGEMAATSGTGFTYYEKKCRLIRPLAPNANATFPHDDSVPAKTTAAPSQNHYLQPIHTNGSNNPSGTAQSTTAATNSGYDRPIFMHHNTSSVNQLESTQSNIGGPKPAQTNGDMNETSKSNADYYKCGVGHTFAYQRVPGFEPIGGYLTLLIRNNDQPGIVAECSELCKKTLECRAFVIDYENNQCFAMLENSSVGLLSLRQTIGKDYFEGFCVANHLLLTGSNCRNKTWIMDKVVDQAVVGVVPQKVIPDSDRIQCRQACLEERLFWCKSAMFDSATGECKLYSIDRESIPQMRLVFTKGVDFFENQCQIMSSSCPYDAIERDITIVTVTKSIQARSTFDCENACNTEISFNCRSYTYFDQNSNLPNLCALSSDSRSTSQRGSVRDHPRTLYAERNCYFRRPRNPAGDSPQNHDPLRGPIHSHINQLDPYQQGVIIQNPDSVSPPRLSELEGTSGQELPHPAIGQGCEAHQFTFERTFGYDFKLAQRERAPIAPTIGIAIGCQQECLRRGERCQSFVVEYSLPYQSCFLFEAQVGANKKALIKTTNTAYFEKVCLPRNSAADSEQLTHAPLMSGHSPINDPNEVLDISPSYSQQPWTAQVPNQLPYYLQQHQQQQHHHPSLQSQPSRSCSKLWSFERFVNHNFTAAVDKTIENSLTRAYCELQCLNEASFNCRSATYDYTNRLCRLFRSTRRTLMSQFIDLESNGPAPIPSRFTNTNSSLVSYTGSAHVLEGETETIATGASGISSTTIDSSARRQAGVRQMLAAQTTAEPINQSNNIDYLENTCIPEPSSCQYRQIYDQFSPYIDKVNHAISLGDCHRQCDQERLFSCKSVNFDPSSRNCMLVNEDLISLNRGQQTALLPKKNAIYSEKSNCEMINVQCNSQEMLVSINFDSPFRGRVMAKGNPEQCFLIGDGQTNIQFPIVFGPKCNSRQEGHNTFVNELVIQQHPVIMTESDKTVRVMCAFEAPDQTITLRNPTSRDNKTGIDVGTTESSRTRHDKQQFNSVISNKAAPPSVMLRILDQHGRDASMINLGDDLVLKIQIQTDGQNSALGIFARNLVARSSSGESLLLIDSEGCPVDHQVFPALEIDPKDGKSLYSNFKAFRFPSSGLVNFEVQIRFCPEQCQPVDCHKGHRMKSYGKRRKRDLALGHQQAPPPSRVPILQSVNGGDSRPSLETISSVMKPGKAFEYVRQLMLGVQSTQEEGSPPAMSSEFPATITKDPDESPVPNANGEVANEQPVQPTAIIDSSIPNEEFDSSNSKAAEPIIQSNISGISPDKVSTQNHNEAYKHQQSVIVTDTRSMPLPVENNGRGTFPSSILMHVDEKVVASSIQNNPHLLGQSVGLAPYGRFPVVDLNSSHGRQVADVQPAVRQADNRQSDQPEEPFDHGPTTEYAPAKSSLASIDVSFGSDATTVDSLDLPVDNRTEQVSPNSADESTHSGINSESIQQPHQQTAKDMPLRFSILVGENQTPTNGWTPSSQPPVSIMNSTSIDMDHVVVPGRKGQIEEGDTSNSNTLSAPPKDSQYSATHFPPSKYSSENLHPERQSTHIIKTNDPNKNDGTYDRQSYDALSSNVLSPDGNVANGHPDLVGSPTSRNSQLRPSSEPSASHNCQTDSSRSRLRTIVWTGTIVIALNICLVVFSLALYFRKVHLRQHSIVRSAPDCETQQSSNGRWPSVILKSKNKLETSLNTHEQFFCKLNSSSNGAGAIEHDYNWPNLSSSSSHSTVSSLASPIPPTNMRSNHMRRPSLKTSPFNGHSSLRSGNFNTGHLHRTILDINQCTNDHDGRFSAKYTNNLDETHHDRF